MMKRADIDTSKFIFNTSNNREDWPLPTEPEFGMVGCMCADRCPPWSLFVVVGFNSNTHEISVIYPRLKDDPVTGKIELGKVETFNTSIECTCGPVQYLGDAYCGCGAMDKMEEEYKKTFVPVSDDYEYKIDKIIHHKFRKFDYMYEEFLRRDKIFDKPSF